MDHLNKAGTCRACYANIEGAQIAGQNVAEGIRTVCGAIERSADLYLEDRRLHDWTEEAWASRGINGALTGLLERWSKASERPIVLMLDEVDALVGDTLISLLRQIRAGYAQRPAAFPQSIILCGVRDICNYRIQTSSQEIATGGSTFNIKAQSLRLGNLGREETEALWRQHQQETDQQIDPEIYPELWEDTRGQPWLVNALGYEVAWEDLELRDRSIPISWNVIGPRGSASSSRVPLIWISWPPGWERSVSGACWRISWGARPRAPAFPMMTCNMSRIWV